MCAVVGRFLLALDSAFEVRAIIRGQPTPSVHQETGAMNLFSTVWIFAGSLLWLLA
jgi:hypothetical protein